MLALVLVASFGNLGGASAAGETSLGNAIAIQNANTASLMAIDGVIGTAVGRGNGGGHVVLALTIDAGVRGIPAAVGGVIVHPYVTGEIFAQPRPGTGGGGVDRTSKFPRPVPIGVSTGHPDITAGTIGARLVDGAGNVYALSNNHVYADVNKGLLPDSSTNFDGDAVIQPGAIDGGTSPADDIGNLVAFEPIIFGGTPNLVDAAIASTTVGQLGNSTPEGEGYGTPSSTIVDAVVGQSVTKYGRTTGSTDGKVDAVNANVNVNYGDDGIAFFTGQIVIKGKKGRVFSAGGDSGSLIVSNDGSNPVALLFAGSTQTTIGSPIGEVLAAFSSFGVSIDGDTSSPPAPTPTPSPGGGEMTVESIFISGIGGKNNDKDVRVKVQVNDTVTGKGVAGATVDLSLLLGGNPAGSGSGTTGSDGSITFRLRNATSGTYTASVTDVTAAGYVWDDVDTASNEYTKQ